jgi:hypothetical protein
MLTFDRRAILRVLSVAGIPVLAGCFGDDDEEETDNGNGTETSDDVDGESEADADTGETDNRDDESTGDDTDVTDENGDEESDSEGDEPPHPADLDISPEEGWGEPHDGVEIPDEPGHAVLVIDSERFELEGNCQGGEIHADDEDEERDLRAEHGHFVFNGTFHPADDQMFATVISRVVGIKHIVGTSDPSRTVEEFDQFALGGEDSGAAYQFLRYTDGETENVDGAHTEADEPFVRIDPSGVITAVGELDKVESGIDPDAEDIPVGEFEFGARCLDGWDKGWTES